MLSGAMANSMKSHWTSGFLNFLNVNGDDLGRFLRELDVRLLAALLHGRVTLQDEHSGMLLEAGYLDPSSPAIDYVDERRSGDL